MKTLSIRKLLILSVFLTLYSFIYAQPDENEKVIYTLKGKKRTEKLQLTKTILLPKGQITGMEYYSLDTTRYYWKNNKLTDSKQIKKLIHLLESGTIAEAPDRMSEGINLSFIYNGDYHCDILTSGKYVYYSDDDTSVVLTNLDIFIEKLEDLTNWKPYDLNNLKQVDKIVITYKKNKKTITNPLQIQELLSCLNLAEKTYSTSCPFYNSRLYFYIDEKVISAAPAHDGCSVIIIEKNYFEMDRALHRKFVKLLYKYVGFKTGL